MKRFALTLVILIAISAAYFYFLSMPRNIRYKQAVGGVLDLTDAEFSRMRYGLGGEWEFYWSELFTPEDFAAGVEHDGSFVTLPSSWDAFGYPNDGFATYRLTIITSEPNLMLMIPTSSYSVIVWANGVLVQRAGTVGRTREEFSPAVRNSFVPVFSQDGKVEIVMQIAGFGFVPGGMWFYMELGNADVLLRDVMGRRILVGVFAGMLLAMFVYHLILFFHRRKEWVYFMFAFFCLFTMLRFMFDLNGLAVYFWVDSLAALGITTTNATSVVISLSVIFLVAFTHLVFGIPVGKVRMIIYTAIFSLFIIDGLFLPDGFLDVRTVVLMTIPIIMTAVSVAWSKRLKESYYNYLYLIALVTFALWPFIRLTIGGQLYMPAVSANLFLVLSQFFILSVSYAEAKNTEQRVVIENAALESLSRMKSDYMANMSHETKTPLTVISVYVQRAAKIYEELGLDDEKISESLSRAQAEIMRVSRMNDDTLRMVSMQAGHELIAALDTSELLTNSAEAYRSLVEKRGNELTLNIPENLPQIFGNADRIIQVVANLLTNSYKHTENGKILLEAAQINDCIRVTVTDNGAGIAAELLPNVFERGISGSGSTGFGLDICKGTIEAHGGEIWLESKPEEGTIVTFTLPVHKEVK